MCVCVYMNPSNGPLPAAMPLTQHIVTHSFVLVQILTLDKSKPCEPRVEKRPTKPSRCPLPAPTQAVLHQQLQLQPPRRQLLTMTRRLLFCTPDTTERDETGHHDRRAVHNDSRFVRQVCACTRVQGLVAHFVIVSHGQVPRNGHD